jgi:hypothetical protein
LQKTIKDERQIKCVLSRENPEKNQKASRILSSGIPGN